MISFVQLTLWNRLCFYSTFSTTWSFLSAAASPCVRESVYVSLFAFWTHTVYHSLCLFMRVARFHVCDGHLLRTSHTTVACACFVGCLPLLVLTVCLSTAAERWMEPRQTLLITQSTSSLHFLRQQRSLEPRCCFNLKPLAVILCFFFFFTSLIIIVLSSFQLAADVPLTRPKALKVKEFTKLWCFIACLWIQHLL